MDEGELLLAVEPGGAARPVPAGTLQAAGLLERQHLQEWIVANPQILGPGVMVVAVEYDGWVVQGGAQRDRLDVLRLGVDGRLVVAELKRGVAPDTVEMQAIKYAAMASRFRMETLAVAHAAFATRRGHPITADQAACRCCFTKSPSGWRPPLLQKRRNRSRIRPPVALPASFRRERTG